MPVLEWRTVSALTRGLLWCFFPDLQSNEGNKYQNITRVSAETVGHDSTWNILFLTRHKESINDDKNDDLYTPSPWLSSSVFVLLMTSQSIADDVTMTRQLWRNHVISNPLDIDFIHGDIHDRSCKNYCLFSNKHTYNVNQRWIIPSWYIQHCIITIRSQFILLKTGIVFERVRIMCSISQHNRDLSSSSFL